MLHMYICICYVPGGHSPGHRAQDLVWGNSGVKRVFFWGGPWLVGTQWHTLLGGLRLHETLQTSLSRNPRALLVGGDC